MILAIKCVVDPDPVGSGIIYQDPDPELIISDPDTTSMSKMA